MTRRDEPDLRAEWTRLSDHIQAPELDDLRRRSEARSARRNSTIAGTGAAVLAIGALGVALGGGPDTGSPAGPAATGQVRSAPEQNARPGYGIDESRPGMTNPQDDSILERLRRSEDRLDVPFPQSMPNQGRPLVDITDVDRFTELADQIFVFAGEDATLTNSGPSARAHIRGVREWLKAPVTAAAPAPSTSVTLTGSQSPQGAPTGLYLVFVKQGSALALYSINGNYAAQVSPVRKSAPGQIRIDTLRTSLALRKGDAPPPQAAGHSMPLQLYTHCGVAGFHLGGHWYAREGGELSDGNGNPPPGWGNPFQPGQVSLSEDGSVAVFTDDAGHRETFRVGDPSSPEATRVCS